jgi:hypothetical protein
MILAVSIDPEKHQAAWEIYKETPTVAAIVRGMGIPREVAERWVELGVPEVGLPSLRKKLKAMMALASQLDIEEGARNLAKLKATERVLINKHLEAAQNLRPEQIPPGLIVQNTVQLAALHMKLNPEDEGKKQVETEDVVRAFGTLLKTIAQKRLPQVPSGMSGSIDVEAKEVVGGGSTGDGAAGGKADGGGVVGVTGGEAAGVESGGGQG